MEIFPGGMQKNWNFRRGGGGGIFCGPILENPGGRGGYMKNPFRGGGYGYFLEPHNKVIFPTT